jgi:hypothetical protein
MKIVVTGEEILEDILEKVSEVVAKAEDIGDIVITVDGIQIEKDFAVEVSVK